MTHELLLNELWTLARLGGEGRIATLAGETRAFLQPRQIKCATDLLRIAIACIARADVMMIAALKTNEILWIGHVSRPAIPNRILFYIF